MQADPLLGGLGDLNFNVPVPAQKMPDMDDPFDQPIPPMDVSPPVTRHEKETEDERLKHQAYIKYNSKIEKWKGAV